MNEATKVLNEIKAKLGMKIKLDQHAVGKDGAVIEAESFEVGAEAFLVRGDERIALPVGEYDVPEVGIVVVVEEGIIAEIKSKDAPEIEEKVESEEDMETETKVKKVTESVTTYFSKEQKTELTEIIGVLITTAIEGLRTDLTKEIEVESEVVKEEEKTELKTQPIKITPEANTKKIKSFRLGNTYDQRLTIGQRIANQMFK